MPSPRNHRRTRTPYLDAAILLDSIGGYSCKVLQMVSPPPRPSLVKWGRAARLYRATFSPYEHPDFSYGWWNGDSSSLRFRHIRVLALLLAHEMCKTGDLAGQGEKHG
jgi:hypothetical protein